MTKALGEWLVERRVITSEQLDIALEKQKRTGDRLGDILIASGITNYLPLYEAVAAHFNLPFCNLLKSKPDPCCSELPDLVHYIALRALPCWEEDGNIIIATSEPSAALEQFAKKRYGSAWQLVITSPLDIRLAIEQLFGAHLSENSVNALYQMAPDKSARHTLCRWQGITLTVFFATLIAAFIIYPLHSIAYTLLLFHILFGITMLLKWLLFSIGARAKRYEAPPAVPDAALPIYTVLVPLYKEVAVLPRLIRGLSRLDYPQAKLDIKLVLEADDVKTIAAAKALKPASHFDIICVPPSEPRTKPKACNYAVQFARGDYVTIYDAEDIPEPQQLRKAVAKFQRSPTDVVCLQAQLRYYNADENLLSRWFDIEYGVLFAYLLKGLEALRIPLPLGGTSNHIDMIRLRELGAWDPYNVTEDADLGYRLGVQGYRTLTLDSVTMEECPLTVGSWMKQRSRWIKGFMQTWLVHMRKPFALYQSLGFLGFFGFQCFIGLGWLVFLTGPLVWMASLLVLIDNDLLGAGLLPDWFVPLTLINLLMHLALHWYMATVLMTQNRPQQLSPKQVKADLLTGASKRTRQAWAAFTFPVYWILHSLASYKALWQLLFRPHYWEKTEHGKTAVEVI